MSRISYDTDHPGRLLMRTLAGYLSHAIEKFPVDPKRIYEMVVVGNSTMRDLFFWQSVYSIGQSPYQSITEIEMAAGKRATTSLTQTGQHSLLPIHPRARVYGAPIISGHVGADAAGMLAADSKTTGASKKTPYCSKQSAIALYEEILSLDRDDDGEPVAINLGTIYFPLRQSGCAEELYCRDYYCRSRLRLRGLLRSGQRARRAGTSGRTIAANLRAVTLSPGYADAHYNLALAYERSGQGRQALRATGADMSSWTTLMPCAQHVRGAYPQAPQPRKARHCPPRRTLHRSPQKHGRVAARIVHAP